MKYIILMLLILSLTLSIYIDDEKIEPVQCGEALVYTSLDIDPCQFLENPRFWKRNEDIEQIIWRP